MYKYEKNEKNQNYGSTPLTDACSKGNYEIVKLLLAAGAEPNLSVNSTPLSESAAFPDILQLMLDRGAKVDGRNGPGSHFSAGGQAMHYAAGCGYDQSVQILLKNGADPKALNALNQTPLDIAMWQLNFQRTIPSNPPETTARIIECLERIIEMLTLQ